MSKTNLWIKASGFFLSALLLSLAACSNSHIQAGTLYKSPPAPTITVTVTEKPYEELDCSYVYTGVSGNYVELRWKLTLKNNTPYALRMGAIVIFNDKLFGELGRTEEIKPIWLDPISEQTVTGIAYVNAEEYLVDHTSTVLWMY